MKHCTWRQIGRSISGVLKAIGDKYENQFRYKKLKKLKNIIPLWILFNLQKRHVKESSKQKKRKKKV